MLWISYGGPGNVTKEVVREVLSEIFTLIHPSPVAAEDVRINGLGVIACDGYKEGILNWI